jgi:hypothetical protein
MARTIFDSIKEMGVPRVKKRAESKSEGVYRAVYDSISHIYIIFTKLVKIVVFGTDNKEQLYICF